MTSDIKGSNSNIRKREGLLTENFPWYQGHFFKMWTKIFSEFNLHRHVLYMDTEIERKYMGNYFFWTQADKYIKIWSGFKLGGNWKRIQLVLLIFNTKNYSILLHIEFPTI